MVLSSARAYLPRLRPSPRMDVMWGFVLAILSLTIFTRMGCHTTNGCVILTPLVESLYTLLPTFNYESNYRTAERDAWSSTNVCRVELNPQAGYISAGLFLRSQE